MKIICPVFYENSMEFAKELKELDQSLCDWIEVRLDRHIPDDFKTVYAYLKSVSKPILFTIRTAQDGGEAAIETKTYEELIHTLIDDQKGFVDVELNHYRNFKKEIAPNDRNRIVMSYHNFEITPKNLSSIWSKMDTFGPKVEKIACMPTQKEDVVYLLNSCLNHRTTKEKCAISMGKMGKISRIMGDFYDSSYTFCTLKTSSAPGQISLEEMVKIMSSLV